MKPQMRKKIYRWLGVIAVLLASTQVQAQRDKEKLQAMIGEDHTTIDAIAGYDENVRGDILILSCFWEMPNSVGSLFVSVG